MIPVDPPFVVALNAIDESFVARPVEWVRYVAVDDEAVLYDAAEHRMHVLNATGAVVWTCFDGSSSLAEIAADLASAFNTDRAIVTADLLALTRSLAHQRLFANVAPVSRRETSLAGPSRSSPIPAPPDVPGDEPHYLVEPPTT